MKLLSEELRSTVPPLSATKNEADPMVWAKFFAPWADWAWYVVEFDGADICFGWMISWDEEVGYFALSELASVAGPMGQRVKRDLLFEPCRFSEVQRREQGG